MRALLLGWMVLAGAAEARRLTLGEAVELAMRQNRGLKLARLKAMEHRQKRAVARSEYFPELKHHTTLFRTTAEQQLEIPAGAFGVYGATGPVPGQDLVIRQGGQTLLAAGTTLAQPLTPLIRIRQANRIAGAEVAASEEEVKRAEQAVAVRVQGLYFGLLIGRRRAEAAALELAGVAALAQWENAFFESEFTHQTGVKRLVQGPKGYFDVWEQVRSGPRAFPSKCLVPANETLSDLIRRCS